MFRNIICIGILSLLSLSVSLQARHNGHHHCTRHAWDYIIVGNGTAGAVLARELSNGGEHSVLVLEWGENRTSDPEVLSPDPFAYNVPLTYDPLYAVNQIVQIAFPNLPLQFFIYSDGRMWGGSSAHNGMIAVRGTPRLYDRWATISGRTHWSYNNLLPYFLEVEHYTANGTIPNPNQRGLNGVLYITQSAPVTSDALAIAQATATGSPLISDYNDPSLGDIGISAHQQYITPPSNSYRSFSVNAFTPVGTVVTPDGFGLENRELRIVSHALVNRVVIKDGRAIGVEYYLNGDVNRAIFLRAKKKVILCAGAIWTPGILERSGIGDRNLLESLGIKVIVDNPNVGEHLINHYGVIGVLSGTTSAQPFLDGFIDNRPFEPADGVRRIEMLSKTLPGGTTVEVSGTLLKPKSRGSVHIVETNPTVYPRLTMNLYTDGSVSTQGTDAYEIVSFLKILQTIATAFGQSVLSPAPAVYTGGDSALLTFAETFPNLLIRYHAVGTARMGQTISDGVVNGDLHVIGIRDLVIADASIEPDIQDGDTAYAAYFIPKVAAKILKSDHSHDHHHHH